MNSLLNSNIKKFDCLFAQFISKVIPSVELQKSDVISLICKPERILQTMIILKNSTNFQFKCLTDIAGIDFIRNESRLAVSYNLLSVRFNQRLRVVTFLDELEVIPSLTGIFMSSNWLEREVWDLYGIFFKSHPDLRRILTDYGFEGHPLRKDFPLTGHTEVRYNEDQKKVISEPVKLEQNYRNFDYESPWEGTKYIKDQTEGNDKKN